MPECKIVKTLRFSAGEEVFFLSKSLLRVERGTIEGARISGEVYLEEGKFYNSASLYWKICSTSGGRTTTYKLDDHQVFATKEEARAYRKTLMNCKFDQLRSSIRNYVSAMAQIPQSALEDHRKEELETLKKFGAK